MALGLARLEPKIVKLIASSGSFENHRAGGRRPQAVHMVGDGIILQTTPWLLWSKTVAVMVVTTPGPRDAVPIDDESSMVTAPPNGRGSFLPHATKNINPTCKAKMAAVRTLPPLPNIISANPRRQESRIVGPAGESSHVACGLNYKSRLSDIERTPCGLAFAMNLCRL